MKEFYNAFGNTYIPQNFITFDDVILQPQYSSFPSRYSVEIETKQHMFEMEIGVPLISSNMDTITSDDMAIAIDAVGGIGIIHRFHLSDSEYQKTIFSAAERINGPIGFSVGLHKNQPIDWIEETVNGILDINPFSRIIICLDVAHAHSKNAYDKVSEIRKKYPYSFESSVKLCVGNIATKEATLQYLNLNIEFLKVGIGCGSVCQTRVNAAHGIPQMTAIMQVRDTIDSYYSNPINGSVCPTKIIADGGIRNSGDVVKALSAGANLVMIGSLFAGTEESPGDTITKSDGTVVKNYRGQSSKSFMTDAQKANRTSEGISTYIPYRGSVKNIVHDLMGGLRSGMSYSGCSTIDELYEKSRIIEVSHAGLNEGHTHILNQNGVEYHAQ